MIKQISKKLSVAALALAFVATLVLGVIGLFPISAKADETKAVEDILDLSKGPDDKTGCPWTDAANNLLRFHFKGVNLSDGSFMEDAVVSEGVTIGNLIVVENSVASKTVAQWVADSGKRAFRIGVYGGGMTLQCENGVLNKDDIKYVTFKAGFMLFEGTAGTPGDWLFSKTASTKVEGTEFATDVKLYVNFANNSYDYATEELTVKTAPAKTVYEMGETFNPEGMTLEAVTATSGTKVINVTEKMCSVDLTSAGEKTVTVSYGGKTVTQKVTVRAPEKTFVSIAYKSGSVSIEQNGSVGEMTLNDLKITANYDGGESEEVAVTADMISVDPANVGEVKGKVSYTVGTVTKSCEINVTVTERTSDFTAANVYPIPLDGYYAGEDGGDLTIENNGINVWFTTNAGFGGEKAYDGLGEKWYTDNEDIHKIIKAHVLINGKTFDELNAQKAGLARFVLGYYTEGFCLRIHTDGDFKYKNVETITLLKGFQLYNTSFRPLGVPTPCDYTIEAVDKEGTDKKMFVRKTESIEIVEAPEKTEYHVGDDFDKGSMKIKAVYTDGGYAIIPVKDRMISYEFSAVSDASPVTVTYNGKTASLNVKVTEAPATLETIAVKDGAKLFLKQYSLTKTLTPGAKLVLTYSNDTTAEVDLKLDMISGYTNETVGDKKATVTYKEKTCEIGYTVAAYDETSTLQGIKYNFPENTKEGVSVELERTDADGLKALWDIDKSVSAIIGKTNGDLVTINGETVSSLTKKKEGQTVPNVSRMYVYGGKLGFHIDDADYMATVKNGAEICLLPGFAWPASENDAWGGASNPSSYSIIENAVVTEPMYFCFKNGVSNKVIDSVEFKGTPKADYYKDDVINVAGLTLEVNYKGLPKEIVPVTVEMCSYDFSTAGEQTVTVSYEGKTFTFKVTVAAVKLTGIKIGTEPTKKQYDFGIDNELDTAGLAVYSVYDNEVEEIIDIASLEISGFDSRKFGKQTITVKYGEFTKTFEIEVINKSKNKFLSIEYGTAAMSYETSQHNSLVITFVMNGVYDKLGSFWGTDKYDYVADYMLINGKKVSELIKEGKVTRLGTWASQLVIHLDTCDLVPATWVDKRKNPEDENDKTLHYIEGKSEVVKTVTFLPGFQWYTTKPASSVGWGKPEFDGAVPVKGAVLKEKIELTNLDGMGWERELKKDENGKIAADALTVLTEPDKKVYKIGEALNLKGLQILAKYEDGGEEIFNPGFSETEGYKKNEAGEQTISYTYGGVTVTFTVTVVDDSEEPDSGESESSVESGSGSEQTSGGGCGGAIGFGGFAILGLAASAVICLKKKREDL